MRPGTETDDERIARVWLQENYPEMETQPRSWFHKLAKLFYMRRLLDL